MSRITRRCWPSLTAHDGATPAPSASGWRRSPMPAPRPMTRPCRPGWRARWRATPRAPAFAGTLAQTLRYGENPHQAAAFYTDGSARPAWPRRRAAPGQGAELQQHQRHRRGLRAGGEFDPDDGPACAIIKHANPCGVARGRRRCRGLPPRLRLRPHLGLRRDRRAEPAARRAPREEIVEIFTEVVIAPGADDEARESSRPRRTCGC
jgi:phosphoribosylaminoimidazolecarboxamide formyltransferase/IMP cyclohydrolase